MPEGIELPKTGTRAADSELEKIGKWERESRPNGQGVVNPQPQQSETDFNKLIMRHLLPRGLDDSIMKYTGLHNGWQEFRLMRPRIVSEEAQLVADNWNDPTKWPKNWSQAYHGSRWYGLWNICTEGYIHVSVKGDRNHQAGGGTGHYCAQEFEYARWHPRPHDLFMYGAYHRALYPLAFI